MSYGYGGPPSGYGQDTWWPPRPAHGAGYDMPFFPIVPRNAPPDDLAKYLKLYDQEAQGLYAATRPGYGVAPHPEWDVNPPLPVLRELRGLEAAAWRARPGGLRDIGQPLGDDPERITDSQHNVIVSATWAQRAMNASGRRIAVDGSMGTHTLAALMDYWSSIGGERVGPSPIITVRGGTLTQPGRVKISSTMYSTLPMLVQVADPTPPPPPPTHTSPPPADPGPPPSGGSSGGVFLLLAALGGAAWYASR